MSTLDWGVLVGYLVLIVSWGLFKGRGTERIDEYLLAGRQMRWWAIGLSVMATQISAITFVGTTGQAFEKGMGFIVFYFGLPVAMVILCATLVPFFYRSGVVTAYEYLEKRFDVRVRTATSFLFLLSRGLAVGVTLYAPSLILSVVLGWSESATILLMGVATVLYVIQGGNRSVIWTDVAQMALIWVGIFVCLGVVWTQLPESFRLRDALALAQVNGRLDAIDLSLDPRRTYTLWSGLIGGTFLALAYFGTDQSQVQRYLSGRSLRDSRLSLLMNAALKIPMQFVILLTGALVFVFFHFHSQPLLWNSSILARAAAVEPGRTAALTEKLAEAEGARKQAAFGFALARQHAANSAGPTVEAARVAYLRTQDRVDEVRGEARALAQDVTGAKAYDETNYVFPTYVVTWLPRGVAGLVIAVIFAAAMSTLSGELNSLAAASVVDFYKRLLHPQGSEAHFLRVSRLLTVFWGGFAVLIALWSGHLGSAIEVVNRFGSYFYGSILGVFGLAVLARRVDGRGALVGLGAGMASVMATALMTEVSFLWYNVVGAVTVFVVGLAVSGLGGEAGNEPAGPST